VPELEAAGEVVLRCMQIAHGSHGNYALFRRRVARQIARMELYFSPFSCSFAAHVACLEAGLAPNLQHVARGTKRLDDGRDYLAIAPQGNVPALALDDGAVLTESAAVLQWIADRAPEKNLAPRAGTLERYRLVQWINFVTSEIHKKHLWMIFSSKTPPAVKTWARENAAASFGFVAAHLAENDYLLGDRFSVADAYLFWALLVAPFGGLSLEPWPSLGAYVKRMLARPSVQAAIKFDRPLYEKEAATGTAPTAAP